ncbi:unnamed protein product [Dracunculus medinensis]|uniref:Trigger_C domain-containing protein n=1 Tax=Dracunculus medinensis TaxID=318479 RepID=A0A0N4UDG3_DRAME|nr:unnamed protein product [Dracunculus medinensis]
MEHFSIEERRSFMKEEMEVFVSKLDTRTSEQFNSALQKAIIESLLDGTVFPIVESLADLQNMTERQLFANRQQQLIELQSVPDLDTRMRLIDMDIVYELDKITTQQQDTLARAGVPGFRITKNCREIILQMAIIRFIVGVQKKIQNLSNIS